MPANDTVHDRIVANIVATLAAVTAGTDFYTSVKRVYEMNGDPLSSPEMPCALVQHMGIEEHYGSIDQVECNLRLAVGLCMTKDDSTGTWQRDVRRLAEDAKKALRADFGRGTFSGSQNAFDTYCEGIEVANEADGFPVALAQVNVRIQYRHKIDDPTVAV
jgi:hypothetical protein